MKFMVTVSLTSVIVTVSDKAINRIDEIAKQLKAKGMRITRVMPRLGAIAGEVKNVAALKHIDGVADVEKDYTAQLRSV